MAVEPMMHLAPERFVERSSKPVCEMLRGGRHEQAARPVIVAGNNLAEGAVTTGTLGFSSEHRVDLGTVRRYERARDVNLAVRFD